MEGKKRESLRKREAPAGASPEKGQKRGRKADVVGEDGGGAGGTEEVEPRGSTQGGAVARRTRSSQAAQAPSAPSSAEKKGRDKKEGGATRKSHSSASQNRDVASGKDPAASSSEGSSSKRDAGVSRSSSRRSGGGGSSSGGKSAAAAASPADPPASSTAGATAGSSTASSALGAALTSDMSLFSSHDQRMAAAEALGSSSSLGEAVSGLRRFLGSGFDDAPFGMGGGLFRSSSGRFRELLEGLKADGDLARQIESLNELCEILCMATEDSLQGFSIESFLPCLVNLINSDGSADVMLLACRSIAYIMESIPGSSTAIVLFGCIPPLCTKLMTIDYIDVAEQALLTVHKISEEHGGKVLAAGGLAAVLAYLDFFPISVQRTGVQTVLNMCQHAHPEQMGLVEASLEQMSNLLQSQDAKLVGTSLSAFCKLVSNMQGHPAHLETIASRGLVDSTWRIVAASFSSSSSSSSSSGNRPSTGGEQTTIRGDLLPTVLTMLASLASPSPSLALSILGQPDIGPLLRSRILVERLGDSTGGADAGGIGGEGGAGGAGGGASRRRSGQNATTSSELLRSVTALTKSLLPELPDLPPPSPSTSPSKGKGVKSSSSSSSSSASPSKAAGEKDEAGANKRGAGVWEKNVTTFSEFGKQVIDAVLSTSLSSIDARVRMDSTQALCRLCYYMQQSELDDHLDLGRVFEVMSALLSSEGPAPKHAALVLVHVLVSKKDSTKDLVPLLLREGIVHSIRSLAKSLEGTEGQSASISMPPPVPHRRQSAAAAAAAKEPTQADLQLMVKFVIGKHLKASGGGEGEGDTEIVSKLKAIGQVMRGSIDGGAAQGGGGKKGGTTGEDAEFVAACHEMFGLFKDREQVSVFEMKNSGICQVIAEILSSATSVRWDAFVAAAVGTGSGECPANILLEKLVAGLNTAEGFELESNSLSPPLDLGSSSSSRLGQALQMRFQRKGNSSKLGEYPNAIMIDPLAPMSAVRDFLLPRVLKPNGSSSRGGSGSGGGGASSSGGAGGKTKGSGRGTRSSTGQGGAGKGGKGVEEKSGMEVDGEEEGGDDDDDDDDELEEDYELLRGSGDYDHDMDDEDMEDMDDLMDGNEDEDGLEGASTKQAQVRDINLSTTAASASSEADETKAEEGKASKAGGSRGRSGASGGGSETSAGADGAGAGKKESGGRGGKAAKGCKDSAQGVGASAGGGGTASSSSGAGGAKAEQTLVLSVGGLDVADDCPVIEAVLIAMANKRARAGGAGGSSSSGGGSGGGGGGGGNDLWGQVHNVQFSLSPSGGGVKHGGGAGGGQQHFGSSQEKWGEESAWTESRARSVFGSAGATKILEESGLPQATVDALRVCLVLHLIVEGRASGGSPADMEALVVGNMCRKASVAASDPVSMSARKLPMWLDAVMRLCPFLLSLDVRRKFHEVEAYGLTRALRQQMMNLQQGGGGGAGGGGGRGGAGGGRQKVRVGRKRSVESAKRIMDMYEDGHQVPKGYVLEVEFYGEVGVGAGPTQEFYSCVCKEACRRDAKLWWDEGGSGGDPSDAAAKHEHSARGSAQSHAESSSSAEHVVASHGLFPAPLPPGGTPARDAERKRIIETFNVLGWVCGKAVHDGRLLDLPLALPLCRVLVGGTLEPQDLAHVCPSVHKILEGLRSVAAAKRRIVDNDSLSEPEKAQKVDALELEGVPLADMCLSFCVPGRDDVPLMEGGCDVTVTPQNVEEYIRLVPKTILIDSIMPCLKAMREGLGKTLPLSSLSFISPAELRCMLASDEAEMDWTPDHILASFKFEHGYTSNSPVARILSSVLSNLTLDQKRRFTSFCTGCPRLPIGGFAALRPPLTVVRKEESNAPLSQQLPSVMTCANYLKMPEYLDEETLRGRLLVAITEADGSFHLS